MQSKVLKDQRIKIKHSPISFIKSRIGGLCSSINKFFIYGSFGWGICECDYSSLLKIVRFFLIRLSNSLENGFLVQEDKTLKSIRICIKLLDRLIRDNYNYWVDRHEASWSTSNKGLMYNEEKKDFIYATDMDDKQRDRDSTLLFSIINKYYRLWWD